MPGFDMNFVNALSRHLYCPLCKLAMREPVRITTCGHRFCDTCLQHFLSEGVFQCPVDKLILDYAKIYPDPDAESEILNSMIRCVHVAQGCHWMDKASTLQGHLEVCRYDSVRCPNSCTAMLSRMCLKDHIQYTCPRRRVTCPSCGQEFSGEAIESHEGNCPQEMVWCENKCGARLQRRFLNNHQRSECHKRTSPCPHCKKQFMFETLQNHFHQCPLYPMMCPNRCDPGKIAREEIERHLQEACPCALVPCLYREAGCKHMCKRYNMDKHMDDTTSHHLHLMSKLVLNQERQISSLTEQLQRVTCVTDGTFLWKIDNFKAKLMEAKGNGDSVELKSEEFYTFRHGYKLGASLFPNGNGPAEGSHVSLYIRVLPGQYDNLLDWPFRLPISFQLLDQCTDPDKRTHIKESFVPNPSWKHFQKPCKDIERMGFGYPRFVSQETLRNSTFCKDDTLFVKIKIDQSTFIKP